MPVKEIVVHQLQRTVGVVCTLLVIAGLGWAVYVMAIKPHTRPTPTTKQEAKIIQNIEINTPEDSFFLGIRLWGFKLGISKPTIKTTREIIKEAIK